MCKIRITRRGFKELSEGALRELDKAILEAVMGKGRELKELKVEIEKAKVS